MYAMVLEKPGSRLADVHRPRPEPGPGQVMMEVLACGVCRTDLHVVDGDLKEPELPIIPGHEIVGRVAALGQGVDRFETGQRVGVPWLGWSCGICSYCKTGRENLCPKARYTGYQIDGGYAEFAVADQRYCFPIPEQYSDAEAAPLLCAGLIGHRSYRMAGDGERLGLYGFGAAAHITVQVAIHEGRKVFAFTRPGDSDAQAFARELGVVWAGSSEEYPPEQLDAAIIFAPVGALLPAALKAIAPGGTVVCAGIHMSDIPSFPYRILWEERTVRSVANLTRRDAQEFLTLAPRVPVKTHVQIFNLKQANEALAALRQGRLRGAAVLIPLK
jgi:propanol-preferring alcohol dehydrogenase